MRGNNKGRIFMSLINHILCLFARCFHPSCLVSLPPSHFKSHSLYHFTDPSEKRRKSREIGTEKKRTKCFYLFIYLAVYPSCCFMRGYAGWRTRTKNRICIMGRLSPCLHQFTKIKDYMGQEPLYWGQKRRNIVNTCKSLCQIRLINKHYDGLFPPTWQDVNKLTVYPDFLNMFMWR